MTEHVYTWNGYRVCKRSRKAVERDQNGIGRVHKFMDSVFETEIEAVEAGFQSAIEDRNRFEDQLTAAQKAVHRWFLRRKKLKTLLAEAARDMKADMYGGNGNG